MRCCSLDCTRLVLYCSSNSCLTLEGTTLLLELRVKQIGAVRAATEEFVESSLVGRGHEEMLAKLEFDQESFKDIYLCPKFIMIP